MSILALLSAISLASDRYVGNLPKVEIANHHIPVDQVCIDGQYLKSIYKISICQEWKMEGKNSICSKDIKKTLRTPIDYNMPLNYKIQYGYLSGNKIRPMITKNYTITECEQF